MAGPVLLKQAMDELAEAPLRRATPALVALVCAALSKVKSLFVSISKLVIVRSVNSNGIDFILFDQLTFDYVSNHFCSISYCSQIDTDY